MVKNVLKELEEEILAKDSRVVLEIKPTFDEIPKHENKSINELVLKQYYIEMFRTIHSKIPAIVINPNFLLENECPSLLFEIAKEAKKNELIVVLNFNKVDMGQDTGMIAEKYLGKESPFDAIILNFNLTNPKALRPFKKKAKKNGKILWFCAKNLKEANEIARIGKNTPKDKRGYNGIGAVLIEDIRDVRFFMPNTFLMLSSELIDIDTFDSDGLGALIKYKRKFDYCNKQWRDDLLQYINDALTIAATLLKDKKYFLL